MRHILISLIPFLIVVLLATNCGTEADSAAPTSAKVDPVTPETKVDATAEVANANSETLDQANQPDASASNL